MAKRQSLLPNFFSKKTKIHTEIENTDLPSTSSNNVVTFGNSVDAVKITSTGPENENGVSVRDLSGSTSFNIGDSVISIQCSKQENNNCDDYDVGLYVCKIITDEVKYKLLTKPWIPEGGFKFRAIGKRSLRFQEKWLQRYHWLVYTQCGEAGALCKYCVIFANESGGKGESQKLFSLVAKPFNRWKDAVEQFDKHSKNNYHIKCVLIGDNFTKTYTEDLPDIRNQINLARKLNIEENRKRLVPIIETIKLCGRQELALRGTADSGPLDFNASEPTINDGNFRAILRMRISTGDENIRNLFVSAPRNAMYISPEIQNDIISICGNIVQESLCARINAAKAFTILADETTDVSRKEQMSLCVRYVDKTKNKEFVLREDFLAFVELKDTTGKDIANVILKTLESLNVNCKYVVGQGYDGAAAMRGSYKGVQRVIREIHPAALYVHCSSHSLNLALCHASNVQHVRNCIGTVKSIGTFIKSSAKRTHILQTRIKEHFPEKTWRNLTAMCETRWVENHDGLIRFREVFIPIVETLEELVEFTDIETSSKASQLLKSIITPEFVISLSTAAILFSYTLQLCKLLQAVDCDLSEALAHVDTVYDTVNYMRSNINRTFADIYKRSNALLESVGSEMKIPRITSRQTLRCNLTLNSPEDYFRISIAIPFFDDFLEQLRTRFTEHRTTISALQNILPKYCINYNFTDLDVAKYEKYADFINRDTIMAEINLWKRKWIANSEQHLPVPITAVNSLNVCNEQLFPNIFFLIKVLATLPVSTATPERTFSTLKRLKTYLRNSMGASRLTGMALMSVHRDIDIINDDVISRFSKKCRRTDFVL